MENNLQKRLILFLCGCIVVRILLAYTAKIIDMSYLPYMGYTAILPAIGFMYIYLTNSRQTGPEVFGDKIWWNSLRPVHSVLYGLFAYYAINQNPNAWIILAIDVVMGLLSFLNNHFLKL